jgi:hypothetical protein
MLLVALKLILAGSWASPFVFRADGVLAREWAHDAAREALPKETGSNG